MKLYVSKIKSTFNTDLRPGMFVATLAVSLLCASMLSKANPALAHLRGPRGNDFSRSASEVALSDLRGSRSNDFSRSASKIDPSLGPSIADEWDEVFDTARSVLAKLPDPKRIETTIKDPALRQAVLRAYQSLKACAKVSRDQTHATKQGTLAGFERDFKSVRAEAEKGEYQSCASSCGTEGMKCEKDCAAAHKQLCGCKLTEFGSFVTKCIFG